MDAKMKLVAIAFSLLSLSIAKAAEPAAAAAAGPAAAGAAAAGPAAAGAAAAGPAAAGAAGGNATVTGTDFDITKFGGKQTADITQALTSAWKGACAATAASKVIIPKGTYKLGDIEMVGPCKSPIEFQLQGTVQAPPNPTGEGWVTFTHVDFLTINGGGVFDGQGKAAWGQNQCHENPKCEKYPISLRFNFIKNAIVSDITSLDSKNFHINVLGGVNFTFQNVIIEAPGNSPNTDGIHIGRSDGVNIINTKIGTGDDCISLGDGSKQININGVTCGPGHGISVGSLGKYDIEEPVEGVIVKNCTLTNTDNGVRIKTWPASPKAGTASDMHFEGITMVNVSNPIVIDQEYCPWNRCQKQSPSKIKISKVTFKNIKGTSATPLAVKLVCSANNPCEGVEVSDVDLVYKGAEGPITSQCANVKPTLSGTQNPPTCSAAAPAAAPSGATPATPAAATPDTPATAKPAAAKPAA